MGRNNKEYAQDLYRQLYERLFGMLENGVDRSKKDDTKNGETDNRIYSYATYHTYFKHCSYFVKWLKKEHPKCATLKKAQSYVCEYLKSRVAQGLSAYTIRTEAAALNKLYNIKPGDKDYFKCPERSRADITRSRGTAKRDKTFNVKKNANLIDFAKATGLRRSELENLKGKDYLSQDNINQLLKTPRENLSPHDQKMYDLMKEAITLFPDKQHFLYVKGKGGRERISPIIGDKADEIAEKISKTEKEKKVWIYVNSHADIHSYRADYCTTIYKEYARNIALIPRDKVHTGTGRTYQSGVYTCRGDESKKKLDRLAMLKASKALGHNRLEIIARHYLRDV